MFSYHPKNVSGYWNLTKEQQKKIMGQTSTGWIPCENESFLYFRHRITTNIWAPSLFVEGARKGEWGGVNWLTWDCDDPVCPTLMEAKEALSGFVHFLGTTQHHQREKEGKPPCDRYRAGVMMETTILDKKLYVHQLQTVMNSWKSDQNCKDMARQYWPCLELVSFSSTGDKWQIIPVPPPKPIPYYQNRATMLTTPICQQYQTWLRLGVPSPRYPKARGIFLHCLSKGWTKEKIRAEWFHYALRLKDQSEIDAYNRLLDWCADKVRP